MNAIGVQDVKNYWDSRPCNIRHSKAPFGTKTYFDEVEARKYFVEPHIPAFADFSRWNGKKVLEVGCGIGTDTMNFARAGAKVSAVDLSTESLAVARQRAEVFGLSDRIAFYAANAEELSTVVPVEPYDLIYSFGVIHHTPNPRAAILEIMKYLGPASELRIMLYAKNSWKNLLIELHLAQPEAQFGCPIAFTYSAGGVRKLLEGLDVTSIEKDHIFPYRIEPYKQYEYVRAFPWNVMPKPLFGAAERLGGWHLMIKARKRDVSGGG